MIQHLKISRATTADIGRIKTITSQVWPDTYVPIIGQQQVDYMLERFYDAAVLEKQMQTGHNFLIGSLGDEDAGFAAFSPIAADTYKLHKLYVARQMHGKGVGQELLNEVINQLKPMGVAQLHLNVNRYNTNAINFYHKFGFSQLYDEDIDIGGGYQMNDHVLGITIN